MNLHVSSLGTMQDRLHKASEIAAEHIPEAKARFLSESFLKEVSLPEGIPRTEEIMALYMADTMEYAIDISTFAPSLTGQTAIDRARRNGKYRTKEDNEAAAMLAASVFRLIELSEDIGSGLFRARDLASGEGLVLFDRKVSMREGRRWALRGCSFEAAVITVGPVTPLDDGMLEAARPFIVSGRGLKSPLRCAETLYRHLMRHGNPMDGIKIDTLKEAAFPFDAADGPLHAIAWRWAKNDILPEPTAEEIRTLRRESYQEPVFEALFALSTGRDMKLTRLAAAYERIILLQLETIHRRSSIGIRRDHETLDTLMADVRSEIADGDIPFEVGPLFEDMCRKAKLAFSGKAKSAVNRDELDKVLARIQALRGKTVAQGCTEEEALAAANKVAEMLERYGFSLSEIDLKQQSCNGESVETDRRRHGPLDHCVGTIAAFCDCRTWSEIMPSGRLRHIFFGLSADVAGARCLYEKIELAFEVETQAFKRGALYQKHHTSQRRCATSSFQSGLGHGICAKLDQLKTERAKASLKSTGRDLVPVKNNIIEDELSELGLNLTSRATRGNRILAGAYRSGRVVGENLDWDEKINAA